MAVVLLKAEKNNNREDVPVIAEALKVRGVESLVVDGLELQPICLSDRLAVFMNGYEITPSFVFGLDGAGTAERSLRLLYQFEQMGVPVANTYDTKLATRDKFHLHQRLAEAGLPHIPSLLLKFPVDQQQLELIDQHIGFPCIVKRTIGTGGHAVHLCAARRDFIQLMGFIVTLNFGPSLMVQKYIGQRRGQDLRVLVIDRKPVVCVLRQSMNGDFRSNIAQGGKSFDHPLDNSIIDIVTRSVKLFDLNIAGFDLLFSPDGYKICEINTSPEFESRSRSVNFLADFIQRKVAWKLRTSAATPKNS